MHHHIPANPGEVTAGWLTTALREAGVLSTSSVTTCRPEVIGQDWGFTGIVARVHLEYDRPENGAPETVVAKFPNAAGDTISAFRTSQQLDPDVARRFFERCAREIWFYQQVAPVSPLPAPRMYHGLADLESGRFVLLLEDLRDLRFGDAVTGCTVAEATAVLDAIAPFHAAWWGRSDSEQLAWIPQWPEDAEPRLTRFQQYTGPFLERFRDRLPEEVRTLIPKLDPGFLDAMQELGRAPKTIAHSDLHLDNVAFDGNGKATIIDWQGVRWMPAAYDVAGFISGALDPQDRRAAEDGLLRGYHARLVRNGVDTYPFEDFLHHYRLALACIVGNIVIWLGSTGLDGVTGRELDLLNGMVDNNRLFSLVIDHDLGALVAGL